MSTAFELSSPSQSFQEVTNFFRIVPSRSKMVRGASGVVFGSIVGSSAPLVTWPEISCRVCLLNGLAGLSELVLEREFHGDLDQAWSSGADDLSKIGIIHFPIHRCGSIELGMIEYVESLQPEFK